MAHNYRLLGPQLVRGEGVHVWCVATQTWMQFHEAWCDESAPSILNSRFAQVR